MQKRNRRFLQGDISFPPVPLQRKMGKEIMIFILFGVLLILGCLNYGNSSCEEYGEYHCCSAHMDKLGYNISNWNDNNRAYKIECDKLCQEKENKNSIRYYITCGQLTCDCS